MVRYNLPNVCFLRSRYSLSNDVFMDILHDMVMLIPKIGMDYMNMCDEEMEKSCKKPSSKELG